MINGVIEKLPTHASLEVSSTSHLMGIDGIFSVYAVVHTVDCKFESMMWELQGFL